MKYLITFNSHVDAVSTKKIFKNNKLKLSLKPLPASLSSDCGICAYTKENLSDFISLLDKYNSIYTEVNNKLTRISNF